MGIKNAVKLAVKSSSLKGSPVFISDKTKCAIKVLSYHKEYQIVVKQNNQIKPIIATGK